MIRETRDEDAPGVVDLLNEVFPSWLHTEAAWLHNRRAEPERAERLSLVAIEDGRIVAVGGGRLSYEAEEPGGGGIGVSVREGWRGRGIGARLYERAETHVLAHGAQRLLTTTHDDSVSRRFAEQRGFRHTMTERISGVDPRVVDLSGYETLQAEREQDGFLVVPMTEVSARDAYAVDLEATRDMPLNEPMADMPFEEWEERFWHHPLINLEASQAIVCDGQVVSFAMIYADLARGKAANEMTGTLREFRGRKLARLAKLATIAWAVEHQVTQIFTGNDETNAPMLAINVSLGYRPIAAELSWVKHL